MKRKSGKRDLLYGGAGVAVTAGILVALTMMPLRPSGMDMGLSAVPARAAAPAAASAAVAYTQYHRADFRQAPRVYAKPAVRRVTQPDLPTVRKFPRPVLTPPVFAPPVNPLLRQLTANPECTLKVPADPLTAAGLMTPYVLSSAGIACSENSQGTAAFVQAVILDPATGQLTAYDPVVTNPGQQAAAPPVTVPPGAVVAIWTGYNGNVLKLTGPGQHSFVNFAQQSYANSPAFFVALQAAVAAGTVKVPALGTDNATGSACPTVRDFSVVDQDQSDNVPVSYGAPFNVSNGSDDDLLTFIDSSLGCTAGLWQVPLQDPGVTASGAAMTTAGPLEEVQAALMQPAPQALVPGLDPFVTLNMQPNLFLQDLYRAQVGQPPTLNSRDTTAYCQDLAAIGAPRLKADAAAEAMSAAPPFAMIGTSLATVLANRFAATWANLTCPALTGMASPITVDNANFATQAFFLGTQYTGPVTPAATATTPAPATTTLAPATTAPATPSDTTAATPSDTTAAPATDTPSTG